jgi:hypothetical protein
LGERLAGGRLEKTVSRETAGERAAMFHVKHWANGAGKRESAKQPYALKNRLCFSMT